jgi:outer membrane protein TolC
MTRWVRALLGICLALPAGAVAQEPAAQNFPAPVPPPVRRQATVSLTLGDAMEQARRNSPAYRQFLNDAGPAGWGVRNAYANLLPSFDVSSSMS